MKLSSKRIDNATVQNGTEIADIPGWGDLKLRARGSNNGDWRDLRARLIAESAPADFLPNGDLKPTRLDVIALECIIETGITGWSGLANDDDSDLVFSKEELRAVLENQDNVLFRGACMYACDQVHVIAAKQAKADAGN